jgi:hypothetical protein
MYSKHHKHLFIIWDLCLVLQHANLLDFLMSCVKEDDRTRVCELGISFILD